MPYKTCPKCNAKHGPRKAVCDCGHVFIADIKNKVADLKYQGSWIYDKMVGMPSIDPPDDLPAGKLDLTYIRNAIIYEGLGFCIFHYINPEKIKDIKLKKLWAKAKEAMRKIIEYMEKQNLNS